MKIDILDKNGFVVLSINERITLYSNISEIKEHTVRLVNEGKMKITVCFPEESFFSSGSIAALVICNEMVKDNGGVFVIIDSGGQINEFLNTLSIKERFLCFSSLDQLNPKL